MILYLKALKIPPKKNLIITFGKVAGYKINIQKPVDFLYTNNELAENTLEKQYHSQSLKNESQQINKNYT
jgi:hypothetical protein